jgi:hypothetical protein
MKEIHMRKFVIAAAAVASMVAVVGMAPSALAANESAQLSSLASGVSISGSASSTLTTDKTLYAMLVHSGFFSTPAQIQSTSCADYGIALTINGAPQVIACVVSTLLQGGGYVYVETAGANVLAGDVVTLTWGTGLVTSTGSLNGPTIEVLDVSTSGSMFNFVIVTPTLAQSSNSAGEAAPVLMWQQAYGRASASDTCQTGYTPSWDTWPNGGKGGFVCNRFVPEYGN